MAYFFSVDEVAAEHIGADSVIHFGRSCLTPTQRLPVLNIFTVLPLNTEAFESSILKSNEIIYHRYWKIRISFYLF